MQSTFIIARRSKCRQNVRRENHFFARPECPRTPNESESRNESGAFRLQEIAPTEDDEAEIVLI